MLQNNNFIILYITPTLLAGDFVQFIILFYIVNFKISFSLPLLTFDAQKYIYKVHHLSEDFLNNSNS